MIDRGIEDRVAVVTGANHGIGAAIARALAAQSAKVFLTYPRNADRAGADPAIPPPYAANRARSADWALAEIEASGGRRRPGKPTLRARRRCRSSSTGLKRYSERSKS